MINTYVGSPSWILIKIFFGLNPFSSMSADRRTSSIEGDQDDQSLPPSPVPSLVMSGEGGALGGDIGKRAREINLPMPYPFSHSLSFSSKSRAETTHRLSRKLYEERPEEISYGGSRERSGEICGGLGTKH